MNSVRAIIYAANVPLARNAQALLDAENRVDLIGFVTDEWSAFRSINHDRPHILFLCGFADSQVLGQLVRTLRSCFDMFIVVLDNEPRAALHAFELGVDDCMAPDVDERRMRTCLKRAGKAHHDRVIVRAAEAMEEVERLRANKMNGAVNVPDPFAFTVINEGRKVHRMAQATIKWLRSEGDHLRIHTVDQTLMIRQTLSVASSALDPEFFMQTHRGIVVNVNFVECLEREPGNSWKIRLTGGETLPVGVTFRQSVSRRLLDVAPSL
jgi:DNA-binding LytR/AlgR family response regulator